MKSSLVLLFVAGLPRGAAAAEFWGTGLLSSSSVQINFDGELRYHHVDEKLPGFEDRNIHDYVEQVARLNLLLSKEGFSAGAQIDEVALFSNRYILDGELYHSHPLLQPDVISPFTDAYLQVEKIFVQNRWRHVELALGDTYVSFGRGIALNIVKNTDIDVDTSVRGVKSTIRTGEMEATFVTGLSNTQQISQDNPNLDIGEDLAHMVTGARVAHYGLGPAHMGVHGVIYRFGRAEDEELWGGHRYNEPLDAVVSGANLELPGLLGIDWYLEGDMFGYKSLEIAGEEPPTTAYAAYGSASAYPGKTSILLEVKKTKDTERINGFVSPEGWEVSSAPTLEYERVITEDGAAAVNSNDISGARLRVDYAIRPAELVPFAAVAVLRDEDLAGLHFNQTPETIVHPISGVQWMQGGRVVQVTGGYRMDQRDALSEGGNSVDLGKDRMMHVDGDVHVPLFGEESLEVAVAARKFQWGVNAQQQADFVEMENAVSWHHGEKLIFVLFQDYSDNPLIRSTGNISDHVYGALEVHYKPSSASTVKVFYGSYKAGIRCSGGQCKSLPGFQGARMSYLGTF